MPPTAGSKVARALRLAAAAAALGGVAVYAAESLVICADLVWQMRLPRDFDRRSRLDVLDDLRAQGVDAVTNPPTHVFLLDTRGATRTSRFAIDGRELLPLGGISRRTSVVCNETGQYLILRTDQYGFNNPPDVWRMSHISIAAVGDSFTHGDCVTPAESYMGRIRTAYPATINLGRTSNGPLFELAALKEYLPALKPERVLWFFFENDIEDVQDERDSTVLMRYLRDDRFSQNLPARQDDIDRAVSAFIGDREREQRKRVADANRFFERARLFLTAARTTRLLRDTRLQLFGEPDARVLSDTDWQVFDDIIAKANDIVRSWGGRLHFVYLPTLRRFGVPERERLDFRTRLPRDYVDNLHARVLQIARKHALPITDLTPAFDERPNARHELYSPIFHYTPEGNRLVANAVLADLSQEMTVRARHGEH